MIFCMCTQYMLYGTETQSVKEKDVIRLERNDVMMVRCMWNVKPEDRIRAEQIRTRIKLKSEKECLRNNKMQQYRHIERIEDLGLINVSERKESQQ